jgi:hypothetical protein
MTGSGIDLYPGLRRSMLTAVHVVALKNSVQESPLKINAQNLALAGTKGRAAVLESL